MAQAPKCARVHRRCCCHCAAPRRLVIAAPGVWTCSDSTRADRDPTPAPVQTLVTRGAIQGCARVLQCIWCFGKALDTVRDAARRCKRAVGTRRPAASLPVESLRSAAAHGTHLALIAFHAIVPDVLRLLGRVRHEPASACERLHCRRGLNANRRALQADVRRKHARITADVARLSRAASVRHAAMSAGTAAAGESRLRCRHSQLRAAP